MQEAITLNFVFTTRLPFSTAATNVYSQIHKFAMSYVNSFWRGEPRAQGSIFDAIRHYLLKQAAGAPESDRAPRRAVAAYFQASDDTIGPAFDAVRTRYAGRFSIVTDLVVINVSPNRIRDRVAVVSDYS